MLSPFAHGRIKKLISDGIELLPSEIIKLNDLGVAVERASNCAEDIKPPKVAWAGDTLINEQTIASDIWYQTYAIKWWQKKSLFYALLWACNHARDVGFFEDYKEEKPARKAIVEWYRKLNCTESEAVIGLNYVISNDTISEDDDDEEKEKYIEFCPYTKVLHDCIAAELGLSENDLKANTFREILDILTKWARNKVACNGGDAKDVFKALKNTALFEFEKYYIKLKAKNGNEQNSD